jgi:hypothetical protein|tara:strand:- start:3559 stop:3714 length:156 start_codon:yes stop_codon:yes gene_type:complete
MGGVFYLLHFTPLMLLSSQLKNRKETVVLGVSKVLLRLKEWLRNEIRSSNV